MCLTSNREIYSFGLNNNGQLGLGDTIHHVSTPEKIRQFTSFPIKTIAWGDEMTLFLTSNSDLFACGWDGYSSHVSSGSPEINNLNEKLNIRAYKSMKYQESTKPFYPSKIDTERLFGQKFLTLTEVYCSDQSIIFQVGASKLYWKPLTASKTTVRASQTMPNFFSPSKCNKNAPVHIKQLDKEITNVLCARYQIFVTANEKPETKSIWKNEQIMNILNSNQLFYTQKREEVNFYQTAVKNQNLKKVLDDKKKALLAEQEQRMKNRGEIFQPVYCRKIDRKRHWLKSEEVSRTVHNKEPLKLDEGPAKIVEIINEDMDLPESQPKVPVIVKKMAAIHKPKTASAAHHKPNKSLKIKKKDKVAPIRLDSIRRMDEESKEEWVTIDQTNWRTQEQLCKELSSMYEIELKRIHEINNSYKVSLTLLIFYRSKHKIKKLQWRRYQKPNSRRTCAGLVEVSPKWTSFRKIINQ